jgi:hypothetical protein
MTILIILCGFDALVVGLAFLAATGLCKGLGPRPHYGGMRA